jgi:hypothetical protein
MNIEILSETCIAGSCTEVGTNSATVQRARNAVKLIAERNQRVWSETDRETVNAINALISFAVVQFHQANTAPREWVELTDKQIDDIMRPLTQNQPYSWRLFARAIEAKLKERNR